MQRPALHGGTRGARCREHRRTPVAKRDLRAGTKATIPAGSSGDLATIGQGTDAAATFDGGPRTVHGWG
eukprot:10076057-Lingulodinium_polyedra.AAC.1